MAIYDPSTNDLIKHVTDAFENLNYSTVSAINITANGPLFSTWDTEFGIIEVFSEKLFWVRPRGDVLTSILISTIPDHRTKWCEETFKKEEWCYKDNTYYFRKESNRTMFILKWDL